MLTAMVTRMAAPRIMSNVYALTPSSVKPSFSMPRTIAPNSAPMTVPSPPVSSVPPITAEAMAENMISVPPESGSIEPMRKASRMPAKPPSTLQSTKLPVLIIRTLMPTSAAPTGLPPVAMVWRPQRVFLSTNCSRRASKTAQPISAMALAPKTAVKPAPAWGWTGKPPEIVNVKPLMRKSMPSVVTKEGRRKSVVIAPLTSPTTPAARSPAMTASQIGRPAAAAKYMTNGVSA